MSIVSQVARVYKQPGHPVSFSSPNAIFQYFKGQIPLSKIKEALEHIDSYTLHREYKKPHVHNPYFVYQRRRVFQGDLIDIRALTTKNSGFSYLLVIIDIFSRKIWVMPLKKKTGQATASALDDWLKSLDGDISKRSRLLTDAGKEFLNKNVKDVLSKNSIVHDVTKNIYKAAIVERANKSIQIILYKYLTDVGNARYIDILPKLIQSYNNRKHRSLEGLTPNFADEKRNEVKVRSIHRARYDQIKRKSKKSNHQKFFVGDRVRIKIYAQAPSSARRAYLQQFHGELFEVISISLRLPIPFYYLKSMNTNEKIEGGFYANELVRVRGDHFKIEKILKTKGKGASKQHLVRWKHFGPQWDSWIKASEIEPAL